jgi:hypothetical protein
MPNRIVSFARVVVGTSVLAAGAGSMAACGEKMAPLAPDAMSAAAAPAAEGASAVGSTEAAASEGMEAPVLSADSLGPQSMEANAYRYASPLPGSCVSAFYDSSFYNWLAFRNTCNQSMYLMWIAYNPGYGGWSWTLRPNQKTSTGYSRSEWASKRGYQMFLCPAGYIPVDSRNQFVNRVNTPYRCLQR